MFSIKNAAAQTDEGSGDKTACQSASYMIGFFNGALSSQRAAIRRREALERIYGDHYSDGSPIQYEVFYNSTSGLDDLAETLQQVADEEIRALLERRQEIYWDVVHWDSEGNGTLGTVLRNVQRFTELVDSLLAATMASGVATWIGFDAEARGRTYQEHEAKLDAFLAQGHRVVLIGHSQGALFMNHLYDSRPALRANEARLVYVAPPLPKSALHGDYTLADNDLVIRCGVGFAANVAPGRALRLLTSCIAGVARLPGVGVLGNVAAPNANIPLGRGEDPTGHSFLGTYLAPELETYRMVTGQIAAALATMSVGEVAASCQYESGVRCADFGTGVSDSEIATVCGSAEVSEWPCRPSMAIGSCRVKEGTDFRRDTYYASPSAGPASLECSGADGTWCAPKVAVDPGVPAWLEPCLSDAARGSCLESGSATCTDYLGENINQTSRCRNDGVLSTGACATEGAIAGCVVNLMTFGQDLAYRMLFYDVSAVGPWRGFGMCNVWCETPGFDDMQSGGACDALLLCACGSLEPQASDSEQCRDFRSVVEGQRAMVGNFSADASCTNVFAQQPELAAQCMDAGVGGP